MAYTNPMRVANGLTLDFTVESADTAADGFLGYNSEGEVTGFASIPRSRVSGGGNLTEATSSVLTITGGTAAVLTSGLTIQVKQAATGQSGYLSSTDWNTFNNKVSPTLTSAHILVGNGSNVATDVAMTGAIGISNAGVTSISSGVIVNADVNASAAIAVTKLAALTVSRAVVSDGSGFLTVSATTSTQIGYLSTLTGNVQTQLNAKDTTIMGLSGAGISTGAGTNGYAITWNNGSSQWTLSPIGSGGSVTGPGASTNTAIVRWNGIGGTSLLDSGVLIDGSNNITGANSLQVANSGIRITDVGASYYMAIAAGSTYTAARTLTLTTGDANRTITLSGNPTLADWFDQSVKTTSDTVFNSAHVSNSGGLRVTDVGGSYYMLVTTSSTYTANRTLTLVTGDAARTLTINASGTIYVTGGTDVSLADGGTGSSLADPGANTLMGWDDTDNTVGFWTLGSGLTYTHASHTLSSTGITNSAASNELMKSNGTNAVGTGIFSTSDGDITLGTGISGSQRTITIAGSATDIGLNIVNKGTGEFIFQNAAYAQGWINGLNQSIDLINASATAFGIKQDFYSGRGTIGGQTLIQNGDEIAAIRFGGSIGTSSYTISAQIQALVVGATVASPASVPVDLLFFTGANSIALPTAESFRIDSTGSYFTLGSGQGGTDRYIQVGGTGSDINLNLSGKGIGAVNIQTVSTGKIGFFAVSAVVQQVSGANLTNNVTSGGTTNQIDNFTDLIVYASDAATIRNNQYQMARKLKQINDGLRLYGIFT